MGEFDAATLHEAARYAANDASEADEVRSVASNLLAELDARRDARDAVLALFASLMRATSRNYFDQDWAAEHEFSVWARLTDDRRAWGYGSEEEIAPLRWLVEQTSCWFDGKELLTVDQWSLRFEQWAEGQYQMVRRVTPAALEANPFPPDPSGGPLGASAP